MATKKIKVYAAGVFDLFHYGHARFLEKTKTLGDYLIVGVIPDDACERYKNKKPIMTLEERKEVIKALRCVDKVVTQTENDPTETLKTLVRDGLKPDIRVCNDTDYGNSGKHGKVVPGEEYVQSQGIKTVRIPYTHTISTGDIKKRVYTSKTREASE